MTVGGQAGQQVDVSVTTTSTPARVPGLSEVYVLAPDDRARIIFLAVRGATVTVVIESPAADFDEFVAQAEALLTSISFVP